MGRPVKVSIYQEPEPPGAPELAGFGTVYGEYAAYSTVEDWINPDQVVDLSEPSVPPPAQARRMRWRSRGTSIDLSARTATQNAGSVDCVVVHLAAAHPGPPLRYARQAQPNPVDSPTLLVGTVAQVIDTLWPPTQPHETGNAIKIDTGAIDIEGLRAGSQTHYVGGEIALLDPRLLRGSEWHINMTTAGGQFLIGTSADFVLQRFGRDGWVAVPNLHALGAERLRVAPAATE